MTLPANIPQCQYIRYAGQRCGSPAVRGQTNCYFHFGMERAGSTTLLPLIEDAASLQIAVNGIMQSLTRRRIDAKRRRGDLKRQRRMRPGPED